MSYSITTKNGNTENWNSKKVYTHAVEIGFTREDGTMDYTVGLTSSMKNAMKRVAAGRAKAAKGRAFPVAYVQIHNLTTGEVV